MKYTTEEIKAIKADFEARVDILTNKDFTELSNNEMAWLKGVAVSSIMAMKKKGYNNDQIMTTHQKEKQTEEQKFAKKAATFTDEQLAAFGLKRL